MDSTIQFSKGDMLPLLLGVEQHRFSVLYGVRISSVSALYMHRAASDIDAITLAGHHMPTSHPWSEILRFVRF